MKRGKSVKHKSFKIAGLLLAMVCCAQTGFAQDVSSYSDLNSALQAGTTPIVLTADITGANANLGIVDGTIVLNGAGFNISGLGDDDTKYDGFTIGNTGSLTVNNSTLSNFTTAITNSGTLSLNGVTIDTDNGIGLNNSGNTIFTGNNNISSNIVNAVGATIQNQGATTISGAITGNGSIINEASATLTLAGKNSGSGEVRNSGTLNLSGDNSSKTGNFTQEAGTTNVTGKFFGGGVSTVKDGNLNWHTENDISAVTKLVIEDGAVLDIGKDASQSAVLSLNTGSSIAGGAAVTLNQNSKLNITGGTLNLTDNDTMNGSIKMTKGSLIINNGSVAGALIAEGGTFDLQSGTFILNSSSSIANPVTAKIGSGAVLDIDGSSVNLNSTDDWKGTVNLKNNGSLNVNNLSSNGLLIAEGGTLNLTSGNLTIGSGSSIASAVKTTITGNLNITDGAVTIDTGDTWTGSVNLNGTGSLDFNGVKNDTTNGKLTASHGTLNINAGTLDIASGSSIGANVDTKIISTLNINGGNVTLDGNDTWEGNVTLVDGSLVLDGVNDNGVLNVISTSTGTLDIKNSNLTIGSGSMISGPANVNFDSNSTIDITTDGTVLFTNNDTWSGGNVSVNGGTFVYNVYSNVTTNGKLTANSGNVTLTADTTYNFIDGSYIDKSVITEISNRATLDIKGGSVTLDGATDTWHENGKVKISNGKLNINNIQGLIDATGGTVELEDGDFVVSRGSNISGADVIVDETAKLILKKDDTVNNISGNGGLVIDNKSTLTFNKDSVFSNNLKFESKDSSTVYITANADSVLDLVKAGTNTGLTITIDGTDATNDLNIDGTNISNLNFLNTVNYSGALTNNGITSNSGDLTLNGAITGSGSFNNSKNVALNSDASKFSGTYTQTAGSTTVASTGKVFGEEKNINGGSLNITSTEAIDYTNVKLGNNAQLNHTAQSADKNVVSDNVVKFTGSGATANFGASAGVQGNYELTTKIDNGKANKVVFNNSTVNLTLQDYTGSTEYRLSNSDLNLVEKGEAAATKDYTFTNLTTDNATLSFNVEIVDGSTAGSKVLKTDTLTITNGSNNTKFNFGNIYIKGEENGNPDVYQTTKDVLSGAQFAGQPTDVEFATGATTSWVYDVKSANNGHSISMQIKDYTDESTLYNMNATEGTRFFQFSDNGSTATEIYHIDQSLSATAGQKDGIGTQANFSISGHDRDKNIISGEIYDKTTHQTTGNRGSFFNIAAGEDVKLDIKNLTIQDAQKTGNGSVVENNSEKAVITLNNVRVQNNEATGNGGAIYNVVMPEDTTKANLIVTNSILNNNTAGGNGGAIYNAGNMAVTGTTFTDNAAAQGGAIYNAGNMTLTNVIVSAANGSAANDIYQSASGTTLLTGTNTIASNIAGSGSITNNGILNISGDNSAYTGTFTQDNNGTTNVTNKFFAGESTIKNGTLNWYTENDIDANAKLTVQTGKLNIGKDASQESVLSIGNGSLIGDAVQVTINDKSILNVIADGTVNINGNDIWKGLVNVEDGKLIISDFRKSNGAFTAIGGEVELKNSTLTIKTDDKILNAVTATIDEKSLLDIKGGNVELNDGDTWAGQVNISDGDLTIDNIASNGIITASGGNVTLENGNLVIEKTSVIMNAATLVLKEGTTTTVQNSAEKSGLALNAGDIWSGVINVKNGGLLTIDNIEQNSTLLAEGGIVNVISGTLEMASGSKIENETSLIISNKSVLDITGGDVKLNNNDIWTGEIKITDGTLELDSLKGNGKFVAEGGTVTLNKGNLNIGKDSIIAGGADSPSVIITKGSNLNITGGEVTINGNDTWKGFINLKDGTLNIDERTSNDGILHADAGNLNFSTGTLTIRDGSYIDLDVVVALPEHSIIDILKGGTVAINDNDQWDGKISLNGGVLNYGTTHSGTLEANTGDLNLLSGSILNIQIPSQIHDDVNVDIQQNALVNIRNGAKLNLDSKDKWSGMINNDGGHLTTTELVNSTGSGGGLQQIGGTSTFQNNSHILITDSHSYITGGDVNILNNSSLWMGGTTAELNVDNLTMANNSLLNVMNGKLNTSVAENMIVNDRNNVAINISPRDWKNDVFVIDNLKSDSQGTLNVSDFDFLGLCPIDRHIKLQIFDAKNITNVNFDATDKQIFTPIGWYDLRSAGGGYYTSNLTKYNPQVFRGQVATMAMWNNQLAIDDMLLNHVTLSSERFLAQGRNANRYAISESQFAPYQYRKEDGGLWFKSYVNFETLSMTQGLNVHNNAYGSIVGADFPVMNLKNGWKFMPTAYIGYNGSHQSFNRVSMYQNGGQGGFMGTFMKNDFVGSILAYGGGYNNEMSVEGSTDRAGNWFAGSAAKAAYNLHATKHLTVQPTMMLAYNIFGRQNWGTDFGTMSMGSGHLNGINVAPGVNIIYARETWNLYATFQYMYNINDHVDGKAGNVRLSNVDMRHGYFQYGFGANKTWKDRLTSYFQLVFRNGGRTGVGFQFGAQYLFDWFKSSKKIEDKVQNVPQRKLQIKSLSMK